MAKFIEITVSNKVSKWGDGMDITDFVKEAEFINADHISIVFPQGKSCMIVLQNGDRITACHSAKYVIGLINGAR